MHSILYFHPAFFCYLLLSYFVSIGMLGISHGVTAFYKSVAQERSVADAVGRGARTPHVFFLFRDVILNFC